MVNRKELQRKLKAADRRRGRRPTAVLPKPAEPAAADVDMTGLLVETILNHVHEYRGTKDAIVISALRGLINHSQPTASQAGALYERCLPIADREDVDARSFRACVEDLLTQARRHDSGGSDDSFIAYMAVLAG